MLLCLLTHERSARRTMLTPLLNGDTAIVEADGETSLTLGTFTYRLVCLLKANVPQLGNTYDAQAAELYVQADLMHSDPQAGELTLYRFHEHTLQISVYAALSEADLADLRRGGVFVRFYAPGEASGNLAHLVLTFPHGTRVQELATPDEQDGPAPVYAALTPGPTGCEIHYSTDEVPLVRAFPGSLAARALCLPPVE